jgi:hypothetical protein
LRADDTVLTVALINLAATTVAVARQNFFSIFTPLFLYCFRYVNCVTEGEFLLWVSNAFISTVFQLQCVSGYRVVITFKTVI